jgi:hypothetical protein
MEWGGADVPVLCPGSWHLKLFAIYLRPRQIPAKYCDLRTDGFLRNHFRFVILIFHAMHFRYRQPCKIINKT